MPGGSGDRGRSPAAGTAEHAQTSSDFLLQVGGERVRGKVVGAPLPAVFEGSLSEFRGSAHDSDGAESFLCLFVEEGEVAGWREAAELLATTAWRLRRCNGRTFVVGTAFHPPQPFWVAGVDAGMRRFDVARVTSVPEVPVGQTMESALRILPRLAIMHHLLESSTGLMVHAAGALVAGRMHLFLGPSEAGKTTLSALFLKYGGGEVVNDERLLLTRTGAAPIWTAWGTPWPGELRIARNRHAPLGGVFFLEKSERTSIVPLDPREAAERLIPLLSIPWYDAGLVLEAFGLCERLVAEVPAHALRFRPDRSAVDAVLGYGGR